MMSRTARPGRIALLFALVVAGCAVGQPSPTSDIDQALGGDGGNASRGGASSGGSDDATGDDSTGSSGDSTGSAGDDSSTSTGTGTGGGADAGFDWSSLFPPPSTTATPPPAASVDGVSCANLACFDVFDCALFHPAEMGPCGFTKCEGLICKP